MKSPTLLNKSFLAYSLLSLLFFTACDSTTANIEEPIEKATAAVEMGEESIPESTRSEAGAVEATIPEVITLEAAAANEPDSISESQRPDATVLPETTRLETIPEPSETAQVRSLAMTVSGEGLRFFYSTGGTGPSLVFGTPMEGGQQALTNYFGEPGEVVVSEDCPGGAPNTITNVTWPGYISLTSRDGKFVGWSDRGGATTPIGVRVGAPRSIFDGYDTVRETSLGTEFSRNSLQGTYSSADPDATIQSLWAGFVCKYR